MDVALRLAQRSGSCDVPAMSNELPPLPSYQHLPSIPQRRKFSFPASFHSSILGQAGGEVSSARRRFSNVSDAVSRKLSNTIGWRSTTVPAQQVIEQGKVLCGEYVRNRLKRSGMLSKKCGLRRMRGGGVVVRDVFPELAAVGHELERMHPKLYTGVARQASSSSILASEKCVGILLTTVARELFKNDVTWSKVVSFFAVAGGLGVDCARQGHPEYVHTLLDAAGEVLEEELSSWIVANGGWAGLQVHFKPPTNEVSVTSLVGLAGAFIATILVLIFLLRLFGKFAFI